jgi:predicted negative regulator of RcsB-dependent stress response
LAVGNIRTLRAWAAGIMKELGADGDGLIAWPEFAAANERPRGLAPHPEAASPGSDLTEFPHIKSGQRRFAAMKKLLVFVLVLVVAVVAVGYWRGWFSFSKDGKVNVQGDSAKFEQDKEAFSKAAGEKAKSLKDQFASLRNKSEGLTGDDKAQTQKELAELEKKHERLEKQLKELDDAGQDKFESIKQDLTKSIEEVEKKIEELSKKLEKGKEK